MNTSPYRTLNESRLFTQVSELKANLHETRDRQQRADEQRRIQEGQIEWRDDEIRNLYEDVQQLESSLSDFISQANKWHKEIELGNGITDPRTIPMPPGQPSIRKFIKKGRAKRSPVTKRRRPVTASSQPACNCSPSMQSGASAVPGNTITIKVKTIQVKEEAGEAGGGQRECKGSDWRS